MNLRHRLSLASVFISLTIITSVLPVGAQPQAPPHSEQGIGPGILSANVVPFSPDPGTQWTIVITGSGPCFSGEGPSSNPADADKLGKVFVALLLANGHTIDTSQGGVATILMGNHHVLLEE